MPEESSRSTPDDPGLRSLQAHFVDEELTLEIGRAFVEGSIQQLRLEQPDQGLVSLCERWVTEAMERGVRLIARYSESPAERIFLNALLMGFIQRDPMHFCFEAPCADALGDVQRQRDAHAEVVNAFRQYAARTGDLGGEQLEAMMDEDVEAGVLSAHERDQFLTHALLYEQMGFWDAFHLMMQPLFPALTGESGTPGADLLVWIPRHERFQAVVRCSGYGYRASEEAAAADRRQDGLFQLHGFQVVRYSGDEIQENPVAVGADLIERLRSLRDEVCRPPDGTQRQTRAIQSNSSSRS
jgi:hypothetical protein